MTTREEFEKWYKKMYPNIDSLIHKNRMIGCWQACDELNKAKIRKMEEELAKYSNVINVHVKMIAELTADNKTLREALEKVAYIGTDNAMGTDREYFIERQLGNCIGIASNVLSTSTSTEHLDAYCESQYEEVFVVGTGWKTANYQHNGTSLFARKDK